jgi:hypothetical protein
MRSKMATNKHVFDAPCPICEDEGIQITIKFGAKGPEITKFTQDCDCVLNAGQKDLLIEQAVDSMFDEDEDE